MTSVLITIELPDGPLDLSVPDQLTIDQLLGVVTTGLIEPEAGWTLTSAGGTPLERSDTLETAGVLDGSRLSLVPVEHPIDRRPSTPLRHVSSRDRARRVIPDHTPTSERIAIALAAFVGRHRPPAASGPVDRMRKAWEWTEHERRLDWLLGRPRIHRTVFIGVVGHRSDELSESIADTLSAGRFERVVLVDGAAGGAITRRLQRSGAGFQAIESGLRRRDAPGIEHDLLFGRTGLGTLTVPVDTGGPPPDAATITRLCESLAAHAGLVVMDCASLEAPNAALLDRSDQIVVSTTGAVPRFDGQTIAAVWGDIAPSPERGLYAGHSISDDPTSVTELAVLLASGWSAIGAATPVPLGR